MHRLLTISFLLTLSVILSASAQTAVVERVVVQYATEAELDSVVLEKGHAVLNDSNPNDLRIGDGVTRGGRRIYQPDWTNQNMLAQWGGLSRWEIESLLAFSIGDISSLISTTVAPVKQTADAAFAWGNHAAAGYLKSETDTDALNAISLMPTGAWNQAYAWGNHANAGYLTAETDESAFAALAGYVPRSTLWTNYETVFSSWSFNPNGSIGFSSNKVLFTPSFSAPAGNKYFLDVSISPDAQFRILSDDFYVNGMKPLKASTLYNVAISTNGSLYNPQFAPVRWNTSSAWANGSWSLVDTNSFFMLTNSTGYIISQIQMAATNVNGIQLADLDVWINGTNVQSLSSIPMDGIPTSYDLLSYCRPNDVLTLRYSPGIPDPLGRNADICISSISAYSLANTNYLGTQADLHGRKLLVDTPLIDRQAANKAYVDSTAAGLQSQVTAITPALNGVRLNGNTVEFGSRWTITEEVGVEDADLVVRRQGQSVVRFSGSGVARPDLTAISVAPGGSITLRCLANTNASLSVQVSTNGLGNWSAWTNPISVSRPDTLHADIRLTNTLYSFAFFRASAAAAGTGSTYIVSYVPVLFNNSPE